MYRDEFAQAAIAVQTQAKAAPVRPSMVWIKVGGKLEMRWVADHGQAKAA